MPLSGLVSAGQVKVRIATDQGELVPGIMMLVVTRRRRRKRVSPGLDIVVVRYIYIHPLS